MVINLFIGYLFWVKTINSVCVKVENALHCISKPWVCDVSQSYFLWSPEGLGVSSASPLTTGFATCLRCCSGRKAFSSVLLLIWALRRIPWVLDICMCIHVYNAINLCQFSKIILNPNNSWSFCRMSLNFTVWLLLKAAKSRHQNMEAEPARP